MFFLESEPWFQSVAIHKTDLVMTDLFSCRPQIRMLQFANKNSNNLQKPEL